MKFRLCCRPYSICKECRVHFEPAVGVDSQWGDLCLTHRKPLIDAVRREANILQWARQNLDKLEPMMLEETQKLCYPFP